MILKVYRYNNNISTTTSEDYKYINAFDCVLEEAIKYTTLTFKCFNDNTLKTEMVVEFVKNFKDTIHDKTRYIRYNDLSIHNNIFYRHSISGNKDRYNFFNAGLYTYRLIIKEIRSIEDSIIEVKAKYDYTWLDRIPTIQELKQIEKSDNVYTLMSAIGSCLVSYRDGYYCLKNRLIFSDAVYGYTIAPIDYGYSVEDIYKAEYSKLKTIYKNKEIYMQMLKSTNLLNKEFKNKSFIDIITESMEEAGFDIHISAYDVAVAYRKEPSDEFLSDNAIMLSNCISIEKEEYSYDYYTEVVGIGNNDISYTYSPNKEDFKKTLVFRDDNITEIETLKQECVRRYNYHKDKNVTYKIKAEGNFSIGQVVKFNSNENDAINRFNIDEQVLVINKVVTDLDNNNCYFEAGKEKPAYKSIFKNEIATVAKNIVDTTDKPLSEKNKQSVREIATNIIDTSYLSANIAEIAMLKAKVANINELVATKADVAELNSIRIDTSRIKADYSEINKLLAGEVDSINSRSIVLNTKNAKIDDALFMNLISSHANIRDLVAGNIDTSNITLRSPNNNFVIRDGTIWIRDNNFITRLQIGKDASGDYSIIINDNFGNNIFNSKGITGKGIPKGLIRDDMIADNANISAEKLNISSLIDTINENGLGTIKASTIIFDEDGQTLSSKFSKIEKTETTETVIDATTRQTLKDILQTFREDTKEQGINIEKLNTKYSDVSKNVSMISERQNNTEEYINTSIETAKNSMKEIADYIAGASTQIVQNSNNISNLAYKQNETNAAISKIIQQADEIKLSVERINSDNLIVATDRVEKRGNNLYFSLNTPMVKGRKYTLFIDEYSADSGKEPYIYNSVEKIKLSSASAYVFTANGSNTTRLNLYPFGTNGYVKNAKLFNGDYGAFSKSLINLSSDSVKIKSDLIELSGETLIKNINGSGGTRINGDRLKVDRVEANCEIYSPKLYLGRTKGDGFLQCINRGLQINAPRETGSVDGIGVQVFGKWNSGNTPYGMFIYKDPNFNISNTIAETANEILLTVKGYISSAFRYNGKNMQGKPVSTNFYGNDPVRNLYPISYIALDATSGFKLYAHDGTSGTPSTWWFTPTASAGSDIKLKYNIKECDCTAMSLINQMKFYSFDWKTEQVGYKKPHTRIGLIAQDLEKFASEYVDEYGNEEKTKMLDTFRLVQLALKGIQEVSDENIKLRADMQFMQNDINNLKKEIDDIKLKEKEKIYVKNGENN